MQEAACDIIYFLDGQQKQRDRRDMANAAAVAGGFLKPSQAWPEFFYSKDDMSFPSLGADMSDFEWEMPTPESYERDMRLMGVLDDSSHLRVPEPPGSGPIPTEDLRSGAAREYPVGSQDLEWP